MKHAAILAFTVLCLAASTPSRAQEFEGFCGGVEGVAEAWTNLYPVGDPATCPELCRTWARSCLGAVRASRGCALEMLEEIGGLAKAQCGTQAAQPEREQCRKTAAAEVDALKGVVKFMAEESFSVCTGAEQTADCIATCEWVE